MKIIPTKIAAINFRQVIYALMGVYMLVTGILEKDWMIGSISVLLFYQAVFNTCLSGSCALPNRGNNAHLTNDRMKR